MYRTTNWMGDFLKIENITVVRVCSSKCIMRSGKIEKSGGTYYLEEGYKDIDSCSKGNVIFDFE